MFKVMATNVVISRGYEGAPALRFSEKGESVRFRIGKKVYDPNAENDSRWINMAVKAFGKECERVKNMKLKDGSFINLIGRLDEDIWTDSNTGETKSAMVIILDDVEYAGGGKSRENGQSSGKTAGGAAANGGAAYGPAAGTAAYAQTASAGQVAGGAAPGAFTGYETFGGGGSFFDMN